MVSMSEIRPSTHLQAGAGSCNRSASERSVGEKLLQKDLTRKVEQTIWLGIISSATMLLFVVPEFADSCLFSAAPPFQLSSDAVEWTMQIASGTTCTHPATRDPKLPWPPKSNVWPAATSLSPARSSPIDPRSADRGRVRAATSSADAVPLKARQNHPQIATAPHQQKHELQVAAIKSSL